MNRKLDDTPLTQLGEELLREFEEETITVPAEFDRKCRNMLQPKKKNTAWQLLRWTARAAVLVFALIGVMSVTVLSVSPLQDQFLKFMVESDAPEEEWPEYQQISYTETGNATMSVYYDGKTNYQILWANEYGQRIYNFCSQGADELFFHDLSAQLSATKE